MDNITITGRLGTEPTTRTTKTGKAVASARVYVPAKHTREQKYGDSLWFTVVAWDGLAPVLSAHAKGDRITVTGRLGYEERQGQKQTQAATLVDWVITASFIDDDDLVRER